MIYKNEIRLNTTEGVSRLLARVLNNLIKGSGDLDIQTARAIIYGASVLIASLQQSSLEKRIDVLEAKIQEMIEKEGAENELENED